MASILTNSSSMAALSTLRSISSQMSTTQERISSGLKVGSASDNAAYWSISTTMKVESGSLSVVGETLGMASSIADITATGAQSAIDRLKELRERVVAAGDPTNDKAKILTEIKEIKGQMDVSINQATFNGQNWLAATADGAALTDQTKVKVLSGITADAGSNTLQFIEVALQTGGDTFKDIADSVVIDATALQDANIQATLDIIDTALEGMTELGSIFGAASSRIDTQKDYLKSITAAIDRGVGALVDADMNEESTRLKALQTQQQLAVQSLSIANSSSESILQLFR